MGYSAESLVSWVLGRGGMGMYGRSGYRRYLERGGGGRYLFCERVDFDSFDAEFLGMEVVVDFADFDFGLRRPWGMVF